MERKHTLRVLLLPFAQINDRQDSSAVVPPGKRVVSLAPTGVSHEVWEILEVLQKYSFPHWKWETFQSGRWFRPPSMDRRSKSLVRSTETFFKLGERHKMTIRMRSTLFG